MAEKTKAKVTAFTFYRSICKTPTPATLHPFIRLTVREDRIIYIDKATPLKTKKIYTERKIERERKSHVYICTRCSAYISYHVNRFQCFWVYYEREMETVRKRERKVMYIYSETIEKLIYQSHSDNSNDPRERKSGWRVEGKHNMQIEMMV